MKHRIVGNNLQMAILELTPGEMVYAEAGSMRYMSGNIQMTAKARGGLLAGLKRSLSGESFFLTEFISSGGTGMAAFAGNVPGTIKAIEVDSGAGKEFIAQKDAFLVAENSVNLEITTTKLGSALFGGEGWILQKYTGKGTVFIHGAGDFVEMTLSEGQKVKISTGCVAGFDATVQYGVESMGSIKTAILGGEGLFITTLTGPGRILLQSMTLDNLAGALRPFFPKSSSSSGGSGGFSVGPVKLRI